tara:strand:+ start:32 stop:193 length:162 start_codon:yes stop_codon:yes gene_type:complete
LRNKILTIHAEWLKQNGYPHENCIKQSYPENDFRDKKGKKRLIRNKQGRFIKL